MSVHAVGASTPLKTDVDIWGNPVESSPLGPDGIMENSTTKSSVPMAGQTLPRIALGSVGNITALPTEGHNSHLSDDERLRLAKIRRNRNQGWMPTFEEFDFLLEIVERGNRWPHI